MKRILVIAAHPDDELLGCGGTVIRHTDNGDEVRSIIVCEGESLRYKKEQYNQKDYTERAAKLMGVSQIYRLGYPDQRLDTISLVDLNISLEKIIRDYRPQRIYLQYGGDLNRDHRIVFESANVALRPTAEFVEEIFAFYTVGSTELGYTMPFIPTYWVDITNQLERKIKAFECYISEIREYPHPRSSQSLRNLALFTGNQCCMEAAESFVTIRKIDR